MIVSKVIVDHAWYDEHSVGSDHKDQIVKGMCLDGLSALVLKHDDAADRHFSSTSAELVYTLASYRPIALGKV